jgi:hypothetical protein
MRSQYPKLLLLAAILLVASTLEALAQDRYVGVRRDQSGEIVLFSLEPFGGAERKIATLQKEGASIQLLGITTLNARRGTFSYAYTDVAAGKDYLHTVSLLTGQTIALIALPADVTGIEVVAADTAPVRELQSEKDAILRKVEALEQDVRRLQSLDQEVRRLQNQVRPR